MKKIIFLLIAATMVIGCQKSDIQNSTHKIHEIVDEMNAENYSEKVIELNNLNPTYEDLAKKEYDSWTLLFNENIEPIDSILKLCTTVRSLQQNNQSGEGTQIISSEDYRSIDPAFAPNSASTYTVDPEMYRTYADTAAYFNKIVALHNMVRANHGYFAKDIIIADSYCFVTYPTVESYEVSDTLVALLKGTYLELQTLFGEDCTGRVVEVFSTKNVSCSYSVEKNQPHFSYQYQDTPRTDPTVHGGSMTRHGQLYFKSPIDRETTITLTDADRELMDAAVEKYGKSAMPIGMHGFLKDKNENQQ